VINIGSDNITIHHIFSNELRTVKTMSPIEEQDKEIVSIYGDMETIIPLVFEGTKSMIKDFNSNKNEQADYIVHVG
jgi:hypothetical protein